MMFNWIIISVIVALLVLAVIGIIVIFVLTIYPGGCSCKVNKRKDKKRKIDKNEKFKETNMTV